MLNHRQTREVHEKTQRRRQDKRRRVFSRRQNVRRVGDVVPLEDVREKRQEDERRGREVIHPVEQREGRFLLAANVVVAFLVGGGFGAFFFAMRAALTRAEQVLHARAPERLRDFAREHAR